MHILSTGHHRFNTCFVFFAQSYPRNHSCAHLTRLQASISPLNNSIKSASDRVIYFFFSPPSFAPASSAFPPCPCAVGGAACVPLPVFWNLSSSWSDILTRGGYFFYEEDGVVLGRDLDVNATLRLEIRGDGLCVGGRGAREK